MRRTLSALLLLLAAPLAHAGPVVAFDGGYALPIEDQPVFEGAGLAGRVGLSLDLQGVELVPEIGVAWYGTVLPQAGVRLILGKRTRPGAYAHLVLPLDEPTPTVGADAGLSLDLGAPRTVGFGLYAGAATRDLQEDLGRGAAFVGGGTLTLRF